MRDNPETFLARLVSRILRLFGLSESSSPSNDTTAAGNRDTADRSARDRRTPSRVEAQLEIIRVAHDRRVGIATYPAGADTEVSFLYRPDHILVAADHLDAVRNYFRSKSDTNLGYGEPTDEPVEGLILYSVPRIANNDVDLLTTLDQIERALGPNVVSPDHLVYVTPHIGALCPATEPDAPNRELPWPRETRDTDRGAGVVINVVDTGWWKPASQDPEAPWLANGVDGDAEQINPAAIHPYGGHGTFVAGVIRCQAPQAEVYVDGMLTKGGAIFESELMKQLDIAVLSGDAPNIVSISGGTHTYNDRPLMTFEHLARKHNLIDNPDAPLIVAAAGNDSTDAPFWPAAFDWVVGVGSLDRDDSVSDYSNHGDWVDIYALGRDHVNAYPTGTYACYEPPNVGEVREFKNLAKWSGTSFSTPLITGIIAGIMSEHGLTAHEAWARLKAHGIPRTDSNVGEILTVDTPGD